LTPLKNWLRESRSQVSQGSVSLVESELTVRLMLAQRPSLGLQGAQPWSSDVRSEGQEYVPDASSPRVSDELCSVLSIVQIFGARWGKTGLPEGLTVLGQKKPSQGWPTMLQ
jgi:hypothetical protein